jgi:hypothetical protein
VSLDKHRWGHFTGAFLDQGSWQRIDEDESRSHVKNATWSLQIDITSCVATKAAF